MYWANELAAFRAYQAEFGCGYVGWQPTKCASLTVAKRRLIEWTGGALGSALELGCGSATLLSLLARDGLRCVGVDREGDALALAREAAASHGSFGLPGFVHTDFMTDTHTLQAADLVFSIGVIEHGDHAEQIAVSARHAALARRWVLIGLPNLGSALFQSFVAWAEKAGRLYEEEHRDVDLEAVARAAGLTPVASFGCHLFLGAPEYWARVPPRLIDALRRRLVGVGGERFAALPDLRFAPADLQVLAEAEAELGALAWEHGFLRLHLFEVDPPAIVPARR